MSEARKAGVPQGKAEWELIAAASATSKLDLDVDGAKSLLAAAVKAAVPAGLPWRKDVLLIQPSPQLVELVDKSSDLQMAQPTEA